jgi:hypothetical protein
MIIKFLKSRQKWWQKPLADVGGRLIPLELAILELSLKPGEVGAWLNSRSRRSGVDDLTLDAKGSFRTNRIPLPDFVGEFLDRLYTSTGLAKGCPDLVIWDAATQRVRLIEVKCPHWDRPSREQIAFIEAAAELGIETAIAEWEFSEDVHA